MKLSKIHFTFLDDSMHQKYIDLIRQLPKKKTFINELPSFFIIEKYQGYRFMAFNRESLKKIIILKICKK